MTAPAAGPRPAPYPSVVPDLSVPSGRIHVLGAGGAAMSAVVHILRSLGHEVSGTDQADSEAVERLRSEGVTVHVGHAAEHVQGARLVVASAAIRRGNPELEAAIDAGIPIATRSDLMESLGRLRRTIAVSGTAGKTTTSAMVATVVRAAGWDPSMIVGSNVRGLGTGVGWTAAPWLVVEADESDGSFLRFGAEAVVVTNVQEDHLDFWLTMGALEAAFDRFVSQAAGPQLLGIDDDGCRALLDRLRAAGADTSRVRTYGFAHDADYRIIGYHAEGMRSGFDVVHDDVVIASLVLHVPGPHNAANALAAFALAVELGIPAGVAVEALASFSGVARRFEFRGEAEGITFVDDYAHLPMKVEAAVTAATLGGWDRVVAVYQPHRFTRTRDLWDRYGTSFHGADVLVVTGIYAAGQDPIEGVSGRLVADSVAAADPSIEVHYAETRADTVALLQRILRAGDVCLTMNAGDLTTLPDELLALLGAGRVAHAAPDDVRGDR